MKYYSLLKGAHNCPLSLTGGIINLIDNILDATNGVPGRGCLFLKGIQKKHLLSVFNCIYLPTSLLFLVFCFFF